MLRRHTLGLALAALFLVTLTVIGIFSTPFMKWSIKPLLEQADKAGVRVEIHSLTISGMEISVQIPAYDIELKRIHPRIQWRLFSPALTLNGSEELPDLKIKELDFLQNTVQADYVMPLFGGSGLAVHLVSKMVKHHKTILFHSLDAKLETQLPQIRGWISIGLPKGPMIVQFIGSVDLNPMRGQAALKLSYDKWELRAPIEFDDRNGVLQISVKLDVKNPQFIKQSREIVATWRHAPLKDSLSIQCPVAPDPCLSVANPVSLDIGSFEFHGATDKQKPKWAFQGRIRNMRPWQESPLGKMVSPEHFKADLTGTYAIRHDRSTIVLSISDEESRFAIQNEVNIKFRPFKANIESKLQLPFSTSLQPKNLWTIFDDKLKNVGGSLEANASSVYDEKGLFSIWTDLRLENISGDFMGIEFKSLKLDSSGELYPRINISNAILSIGTLGNGLPIEELSARIILPSLEKIVIDNLKSNFQGGRLRMDSTVVALPAGEFKTRIILEQVNLESMLRSLELEKIQGQGKLQGQLDVEYTSEGLTLRDVEFKNMGPGRIVYAAGDIPLGQKKIEYLDDFNALLKQGQQALVMKALEDFRYSKLLLTANRSPEKGLSLSIHLLGSNPALAKGQPFELNLPITGSIESLIKQSFFKSNLERQRWKYPN